MKRNGRKEEDWSGSILIEIIPRGAYVKVCAVDPMTGAEAAIVGDASSPREHLERLAVRKLRYVMEKNAPNANKPQ